MILLDLLDDFIEYLQIYKNQSLIAKIFGVYTIKTDRFVPVDMIVMENTAKISHQSFDKLVFDIKGSTHARKTFLTEETKFFWKNQLNYKKVLKD